MIGEKFDCHVSCLVTKKVARIPLSVLKIGKVIGKGHFGQVVLSKAICPQKKLKHMEWCPPNKSVRVVLKELLKSDEKHNTSETDFVNEINVTWELSQGKLKSKNIVRMFGVVMGHKNPMNPQYIVLEECQFGSLEGYLQNPNNTMSQTLALELIKNITSGMKHIHTIGYVHRDLACRNVLLGYNPKSNSNSNSNSNMVAKVGDFGMCRPKYLEDDGSYLYRETQKMQIPIRWSSGDAFIGKFSEKSDLWSFGITVCELYSRAKVPYSNTMNFNNSPLVSNKEIQEFVTQGGRHSQPNTCPTMIYDILQRCWESQDTNNNPISICSFVELDNILKKINKVETRLPEYF